MNDKWIWSFHISSKYNVTSVYNLLISRLSSSTHDHNTYFWHNEVPLKVNIFAWWLFHNQLPTTDNLIRRRILQPTTHYCSGGCGSSKDIDLGFLSCDFCRQIWYDIFKWLSIVTVKPAHVKDHLLQFQPLNGFFAKNSSIQFTILNYKYFFFSLML